MLCDGLGCLCRLALQLSDDYFHILIAGIFRQMGPSGAVLRIPCLHREVLLFPVREGKRSLGVGKENRNRVGMAVHH